MDIEYKLGSFLERYYDQWFSGYADFLLVMVFIKIGMVFIGLSFCFHWNWIGLSGVGSKIIE